MDATVGVGMQPSAKDRGVDFIPDTRKLYKVLGAQMQPNLFFKIHSG